MRRMWMVAALLGAGLALGGCGFEHAFSVDYDNMISEAGSGGGPYQIKGFVHSEAWTPAFLYVFPLLPSQSPERARELAVEKAKSLGADSITDVQLHVETHMPFLWVAGWTECHVSATAVRRR
ncbi:MAG: hypothetical protein HY812_09145 [Planctomycetes bacterium]|nr:hypothetical protein [Planctomycetota bacterium]